MIRFQGVSKSYGRRPGRGDAALRGLDLRVRRGECLALVGPNGAGKSTAIGLTLGFLHPTEGRVRVGGKEPAGWVRSRGAGYLPERYDPPPRLRAREVLRRLALLDGTARREAGSAADAALVRVGLEGSGRERVSSLSRGNRQRLGVAQLLLRPRRLLVLDEPWSGLDAEGRRRLRRLLAELRRAGPDPALLLASHELDQVARVADRAVLLSRGRSAGERGIRAGEDGASLERWILEAGGSSDG